MERLDLTKIQIAAVAAHLRDLLDEDERAYLDTLEGSTDLYEWTARLLDRIEADEGEAQALAEQIANRTVRKNRAEARIKVSREAIQALLQCAKLDKLSLPEATVSIRDVPPKAIVTDPEQVPDELCQFKRSPVMALIKAEVEAGRAVAGVSLDNGSVSLMVRRK